MRINRALLLFLLACPGLAIGQFLPKEGSVLNYRIIGFSFPARAKVNHYMLEVSQGRYYSTDSFKKNIVACIDSKENKIIGEVPAFGRDYTWRVVCCQQNGDKPVTGLCHFSTGMVPAVDTSVLRLRILQPAQKYADAYVFLDDNGALYDMKGNPVWYMPPINGRNVIPRDLKMTPQGTLTMMYDPPYEINYNGDVLWPLTPLSANPGLHSEHYHHETTRLQSGHYMALGEDSANFVREIPADGKGTPAREITQKTQFGTLIEYDEQGNVVWRWRSSDYFLNSDLKYFVPTGGAKYVDVHENAFYFDEASKYIYISFKNISRIIKIKYPEGTVVQSYGVRFEPGGRQSGESLYFGQHACKISSDHDIYMFNNNSCDSIGLPQVLVMKEPAEPGAPLKKIWEYDCTTTETREKLNARTNFISGGNVEELPDKSIFVCMSGGFSKMFIVNPEKKILWSAIAERKSPEQGGWRQVTQYRASIVKSPQELAQLIWNAEKTPAPPTAHVLSSH